MNTLPVTSYPYTSLSASYPHDDYMSYDPYFQQYSNGFYFHNHNVFDSIDDISFNKYTGFYLTDLHKNKEIINNIPMQNAEDISYSFLNLFRVSDSNYVKLEDDGYLYANSFSGKEADVFQVIVEGDRLYFTYNKTSYFIIEESTPWKLKLYNNAGLPPSDEDSYKFKYFKFNGNYVISTTYGDSGVRERYLKASTTEDYLGFTGVSLSDVNVQTGFKILDYNYKPEVNLTGLNEQSWFYSYHNSPIDFENNLNLEPNMSKSVSGIKQNFLASNPYQTKINKFNKTSEGFPIASMDLDVFGMKNLKNPNYNYSNSPYNAPVDDNFDAFCDLSPECQYNNREYKKIFTGTNQEFGYEEPQFLFKSNNKNIIFQKDHTSYFHYPSSAPIITVEDSGLIEAGAFPSRIPFFADKLFKKDAQYGKFTHWGDSSQFQNGQFLCTWLSGDNNSSIWMDRWYLPSEITKFEALTSTYPEHLSCGIKNADEQNKIVFDVPSVLTFEPEVWYKYFHVGENFIDYGVDEVLNYDDKHLSLHFEDFTNSTVEDKSINGNDGDFVNFNFNIKNFKSDETDIVAELNGVDEYIDINYSDNLKPIDNSSFSIWAYSEDWTKAKNAEIISNGVSNYINLKISNGLETPIYCIYGQDTNQLIYFNSNNKTYKIIPLSEGELESNVDNLCIDSNLNVWVLDNANNFLYKTNYNGVIEFRIDFQPEVFLKDLTLDSNDNVYLLNTNSGDVSSFDSEGSLVDVDATSFTSSAFTIEVDLEDDIVGFEGHKLRFDSLNSPWILPIERNNIFRNKVPILGSGQCNCVEDFAINSENNIYVLYDNNKLLKLDSVGIAMLSAEIPLPNSVNEFGNITIQNDYYATTEKDENFVLIFKGGSVYTFDHNLRFIKKNNASVLSYESNYKSFLTDWSGYNSNRKYTYLKDFNGDKNVEAIFTVLSPTKGIINYPLSISSERLHKGWHNFTLTFDSDNNEVKFYVDSLLEDRYRSIPGDSNLYRTFKNSMFLGAKMGLVQSFTDEVLLKGKYLFKGKIDDFRVYSKTLNELEVELLFYSKGQFKDLTWSIPTGNQYYIEHVHQFFKHKTSGSKSNHYNVKIIGFEGGDANIRGEVESVIKNTVQKVSPVYTQLNEIKWIEKCPSR